MSFVVSSPAALTMYLPCPWRPSESLSFSLNSQPWSTIQSMASAELSHQILTSAGSAVSSDTAIAFSNMRSALSSTSGKFCGMFKDDP